MSNENEAFEKWFDKQLEVGYAFTSDEQITRWAWKAAKADSAQEHSKCVDKLVKENSELKAIIEMGNDVEAMEITQLKAHINELREALERINHAAKGIAMSYIHTQCKEALAKTPAQSLQAHDDEVIERCAKVCENSDRHRGEYFATKIRTLKGKNV